LASAKLRQRRSFERRHHEVGVVVSVDTAEVEFSALEADEGVATAHQLLAVEVEVELAISEGVEESAERELEVAVAGDHQFVVVGSPDAEEDEAEEAGATEEEEEDWERVES
jgi:hypothetical protein